MQASKWYLNQWQLIGLLLSSMVSHGAIPMNLSWFVPACCKKEDAELLIWFNIGQLNSRRGTYPPILFHIPPPTSKHQLQDPTSPGSYIPSSLPSKVDWRTLAYSQVNTQMLFCFNFQKAQPVSCQVVRFGTHQNLVTIYWWVLYPQFRNHCTTVCRDTLVYPEHRAGSY